jgi:hypothetical protein
VADQYRVSDVSVDDEIGDGLRDFLVSELSTGSGPAFGQGRCVNGAAGFAKCRLTASHAEPSCQFHVDSWRSLHFVYPDPRVGEFAVGVPLVRARNALAVVVVDVVE